MKYYRGEAPKWKSKPKPSPLDSHTEYQKVCSLITTGALKPFEYNGVYINEAVDGERLNSKHPWRLVRDHLRRFLKELRLEADYRLIAKQTNEPGIWFVGVQHMPREAALSTKAASRPPRR